MKGKTKKIIDVLITYCLLIVVAFVFFFPGLWLVLSSLSSTGNLYSIPGFFPSGYSLDSFIDLFTDTAMYDYPHWLLNTLIVAVANCVLSTLLIILTAYVISRFEFKLRRPLMKGALILGMFPSFMSMTIIYISIPARHDSLVCPINRFISGRRTRICRNQSIGIVASTA